MQFDAPVQSTRQLGVSPEMQSTVQFDAFVQSTSQVELSSHTTEVLDVLLPSTQQLAPLSQCRLMSRPVASVSRAQSTEPPMQ